MANDAFVSYSAKDSLVVDSICAALEADGIKCWLAPRDILPGEKYSQSIITAIGESHLMILVFSANANESNHVVSEVDRAYNKHKPIIPFRIQDVPLSPALEYYLSTAQWQDALTPPLEKHLPKLIGTVKAILRRLSTPASPLDQPQVELPRSVASENLSPRVRPGLTSKSKYLILACSIVAVCTVFYLAWTAYRAKRASSSGSSPASAPNRTQESTSTTYHDVVLMQGQGFSGIDLDDNGNIYWVEATSGTLGTFDVEKKALTVLLRDLSGPIKIRISGKKAYFVELGTEQKYYKDGSLSFLDLSSNRVHKVLDGLNYPNDLWVSPLDDVYILEAGGSSTSFGGVNQLSILRGGATKKVVLVEGVIAPTCIAADTLGSIFLGHMGDSVPGDTGSLEFILWDFNKSSKVLARETMLDKLASPQDLGLDRYGNVYVAGFGEKKGNFNGITLIPSTRPYKATPLKTGVYVSCLALGKNGDIFYSTGRTDQSLRVLRVRNGPLKSS